MFPLRRWASEPCSVTKVLNRRAGNERIRTRTLARFQNEVSMAESFKSQLKSSSSWNPHQRTGHVVCLSTEERDQSDVAYRTELQGRSEEGHLMHHTALQ
jgi:hypothetical protein